MRGQGSLRPVAWAVGGPDPGGHSRRQPAVLLWDNHAGGMVTDSGSHLPPFRAISTTMIGPEHDPRNHRERTFGASPFGDTDFAVVVFGARFAEASAIDLYYGGAKRLRRRRCLLGGDRGGCAGTPCGRRLPNSWLPRPAVGRAGRRRGHERRPRCGGSEAPCWLRCPTPGRLC